MATATVLGPAPVVQPSTRKRRSVPVVNLYSVHAADCKYKGKSRKISCLCPKQLRYYQNGKEVRIATPGIVDSEQAMQAQRNLQAQLEAIAKGETPKSETKKGKTLEEAIEVFLDAKETQHAGGELTLKHCNRLRCELEHFRDYCAGLGLLALAAIESEHVLAYKNIEAVLPPESADLTMPEDALYGRLGESARALGTPLGHAYPAVLVVFSSIPTMDYMCGTRIGIYAAIIAPVGAGKNTSLDRATKLFSLERGKDWAITTASSDRGLMQKIGSKTTGKGPKRETVPGPKKLLLRTPEMSATLKKAAIESSTLSDMLCEVWDSGLWECSDKLGTQECDCRLSWAGGVPVSEEDPDSFSALFSKFTSYGLMSRMILGYSPVRFVYRDEIDDHWAPPPTGVEAINLNPIEAFVEALDNSVAGPCVEGWEPEAQKMLHDWKRPDLDGRIKYNLKKVALISASANRDKTVTAACLAAAIKFMDWQLRLREVFRPSEAIGTPESTLAEIMMRKFRIMQGCIEDRTQILWRKVAHDMKWLRHGPALLKRTIESLVAVGELG